MAFFRNMLYCICNTKRQEVLFMFLSFTKQFGKPVCVLLYGVFGFLAGKKKPLPLLILLGLHTLEVFTKGLGVAAARGIGKAEAFCQCLAFGFTWWLPLKKES